MSLPSHIALFLTCLEVRPLARSSFACHHAALTAQSDCRRLTSSTRLLVSRTVVRNFYGLCIRSYKLCFVVTSLGWLHIRVNETCYSPSWPSYNIRNSPGLVSRSG